jgi:peptidase M28-like protein
VNRGQVRRNLEFLAGTLAHRGSNTDSERSAARHIAEGLREHIPDTEVDDFHSIENRNVLFAAYYGEFVVVSVLALWWPQVAFGYGLAVFFAYQAEFLGYHVCARLLPQFETQNVVARVLSPAPRHLFIVTAHYDSPKSSPLEHPKVSSELRSAHTFLVGCMVIVLATCLTQAFGLFATLEVPVDVVLRWAAVACLASAAGFLFYCETTAEYACGAVRNASGVAALMDLAERLHANPLKDADVWFVATGSKEAWLNGMRHLVASHRFEKHSTYFLNFDSVGGGQVQYVTAEGMLNTFRSSREMLDACKAVASDHGAVPVRHNGLPTDALIPLVRGYKALTITSERKKPRLSDYPCDDSLFDVELASLEQATDLGEALLRRLEQTAKQ